MQGGGSGMLQKWLKSDLMTHRRIFLISCMGLAKVRAVPFEKLGGGVPGRNLRRGGGSFEFNVNSAREFHWGELSWWKGV